MLDAARVDQAVFDLRPDYRAMLIAADGITPMPSDDVSESLLLKAETIARQTLHEQAIEDIPHIAAWRQAYRSLGAKPQRTRNSVEALTRRAEVALPRINRLTDIYNAISVIHQLPVGGEDLLRYSGAPQLIRATGSEPFDTTADGADIVEHPDPGEVVWCDDAGVTCRRWNWRQARRTQLTDDTTTALFILDVLDPMTDGQLHDAADDLIGQLTRLGPSVHVVHRLLANR